MSYINLPLTNDQGNYNIKKLMQKLCHKPGNKSHD
jgi:hypothetical protein